MKHKCKICKRGKKLAYGQKFDQGNWCSGCDAAFMPNINKKRERQTIKKIIKKFIDENNSR